MGTRPLAEYDTGWEYLLPDGLGSVRQLADHVAQVTLARGYMPYGERLWSVGNGSSAYGYTGEDWNTTIQMVFLRARYYNSALGRFTQQDPSGLEQNLYAYAMSNPVNFTDPSGYGSCRELPLVRDVVECYQNRLVEWLRGVGAFNNLPPVQRQIIENLLNVQWLAPFDSTGLEGDWYGLYWAWVLDLRPSSIGTWSAGPNGEPQVTITSQGYINDLKKKPAYQDAKSAFKKKYPSIYQTYIGAQATSSFGFSGPGSAGQGSSGRYNALEWFLGSYDYIVTATSFDTPNSTINVEMVVTNRSHWESGTRVPPSWIGKEILPGIVIPPYLVPNWVGERGPGAAFWQKFVWPDSIRNENDCWFGGDWV